MATSTELKESLQKISALMGLLRSDILKLSETHGKRGRVPVVDHIHWIADQLDELGDGLVGPNNRTHARPHKAPAAASSKPAPATSSARGRSSPSHSSHTSSGRPSSGHKSAPHMPRHAAHHDAARPSPRRHVEHRGGMTDIPPIPDDPKHPHDGSDDAALRQDLAAPRPENQSAAPHDEAPATPPLPDVPKMPGDDKLH